jgi:hypothetical protein
MAKGGKMSDALYTIESRGWFGTLVVGRIFKDNGKVEAVLLHKALGVLRNDKTQYGYEVKNGVVFCLFQVEDDLTHEKIKERIAIAEKLLKEKLKRIDELEAVVSYVLHKKGVETK